MQINSSLLIIRINSHNVKQPNSQHLFFLIAKQLPLQTQNKPICLFRKLTAINCLKQIFKQTDKFKMEITVDVKGHVQFSIVNHFLPLTKCKFAF